MLEKLPADVSNLVKVQTTVDLTQLAGLLTNLFAVVSKHEAVLGGLVEKKTMISEMEIQQQMIIQKLTEEFNKKLGEQGAMVKSQGTSIEALQSQTEMNALQITQLKSDTISANRKTSGEIKRLSETVEQHTSNLSSLKQEMKVIADEKVDKKALCDMLASVPQIPDIGWDLTDEELAAIAETSEEQQKANAAQMFLEEQQRQAATMQQNQQQDNSVPNGENGSNTENGNVSPNNPEKEQKSEDGKQEEASADAPPLALPLPTPDGGSIDENNNNNPANDNNNPTNEDSAPNRVENEKPPSSAASKRTSTPPPPLNIPFVGLNNNNNLPANNTNNFPLPSPAYSQSQSRSPTSRSPTSSSFVGSPRNQSRKKSASSSINFDLPELKREDPLKLIRRNLSSTRKQLAIMKLVLQQTHIAVLQRETDADARRRYELLLDRMHQMENERLSIPEQEAAANDKFRETIKSLLMKHQEDTTQELKDMEERIKKKAVSAAKSQQQQQQPQQGSYLQNMSSGSSSSSSSFPSGGGGGGGGLSSAGMAAGPSDSTLRFSMMNLEEQVTNLMKKYEDQTKTLLAAQMEISSLSSRLPTLQALQAKHRDTASKLKDLQSGMSELQEVANTVGALRSDVEQIKVKGVLNKAPPIEEDDTEIREETYKLAVELRKAVLALKIDLKDVQGALALKPDRKAVDAVSRKLATIESLLKEKDDKEDNSRHASIDPVELAKLTKGEEELTGRCNALQMAHDEVSAKLKEAENALNALKKQLGKKANLKDVHELVEYKKRVQQMEDGVLTVRNCLSCNRPLEKGMDVRSPSPPRVSQMGGLQARHDLTKKRQKPAWDMSEPSAWPVFSETPQTTSQSAAATAGGAQSPAPPAPPLLSWDAEQQSINPSPQQVPFYPPSSSHSRSFAEENGFMVGGGGMVRQNRSKATASPDVGKTTFPNLVVGGKGTSS